MSSLSFVYVSRVYGFPLSVKTSPTLIPHPAHRQAAYGISSGTAGQMYDPGKGHQTDYSLYSMHFLM